MPDGEAAVTCHAPSPLSPTTGMPAADEKMVPSHATGEQTSLEEAETFLRLVLPEDAPCYAMWRRRGGNRFFRDTDKLAADMYGRTDVYFSIIGHTETAFIESKRPAEFGHSGRAVFIDIDAGSDKYARHGDKVYATQDAALDAIRSACERGIIHMPSMLVSSGHGLHLWWVLDKSMPIDVWHELGQRVANTLLDHGIRVDRAALAKTQLARMPGTFNGKGDQPVRLLTPEWLTGERP